MIDEKKKMTRTHLLAQTMGSQSLKTLTSV